jgi:type IV pilus assembly protein PilE
MRRRQTGVTLIELVTVMVIVAILTAMAIPGYRQYVIRANRSDAKTALLSTAAALERCYTRFNTYQNPPCNVQNDVVTPNNTYVVRIVPAAASFVVRAIPLGSQVKDTKCSTLWTNEMGEHKTTGSAPAADCWSK